MLLNRVNESTVMAILKDKGHMPFSTANVGRGKCLCRSVLVCGK